jgi:dipeptidyl aminopeptidase/acylaminoacyl peptidase
MPARFVAEADGRIVVVSVQNGRVERHLTDRQTGGGAADPAVSPDGRTVWFSRGDGTCAAHLASVPLAGGKEQAVPGSGEAGPENQPLPRPGRAQIAFARSDCDEPGEALVVGDLRGLEGYGQTGLVPLAWSRDGNHLLAVTSDGGEVHLLDVNKAGAIVTDTELAPADRSPHCRLEIVGFSPDDNDGYVAIRRCGRSGEDARRSLVLLDRNGGARKVVLRLPRGLDFVDRIAFDPTGRSVLYSTAPSEMNDSAGGADPAISLWLRRDGESRRVTRQSPYRNPSWLP